MSLLFASTSSRSFSCFVISRPHPAHVQNVIGRNDVGPRRILRVSIMGVACSSHLGSLTFIEPARSPGSPAGYSRTYMTPCSGNRSSAVFHSTAGFWTRVTSPDFDFACSSSRFSSLILAQQSHTTIAAHVTAPMEMGIGNGAVKISLAPGIKYATRFAAPVMYPIHFSIRRGELSAFVQTILARSARAP